MTETRAQATSRGSRRCGALTVDGTPCRAWAERGSDPPRCSSHRGWGGTTPDEAALLGLHDAAPPLQELAEIQDVIEDLATKQAQLSRYIDHCLRDGADLAGLARLFALHGQNASRLGRLLRDQRALSGAAADGITGAIAQALDELSNELGADL